MTLGTTEGDSPRDIKGYAWDKRIPGRERMMALIRRACEEGEGGSAANTIEKLLRRELDAENPDELIPSLSENLWGSVKESDVLCDVRKKSRTAGYRVVAIVRELAEIEDYVTAISKVCHSIEKKGIPGTIDDMPNCGEYTGELSRGLQMFLPRGQDNVTQDILKIRAREKNDGKKRLEKMLKRELEREDWGKNDKWIILKAQVGMSRRAKQIIRKVLMEAKKGVFLEKDDYQYQPRPRIHAPTFAGDIVTRINDACKREFPTRVALQKGRPAAPTTAKRVWRARV